MLSVLLATSSTLTLECRNEKAAQTYDETRDAGTRDGAARSANGYATEATQAEPAEYDTAKERKMMKHLVLAACLSLAAAPAWAVYDGWNLFQCQYDSVTQRDIVPCQDSWKGTFASSSACTAAANTWCNPSHVNPLAKLRWYCTNPSNGAVTNVCEIGH